MKSKPAMLLFICLLSNAIRGHGDRGPSEEIGVKHQVILTFGSMFQSGETTVDGKPERYTYLVPTISVIYLKKNTARFGTHWEAAIGLGESYGGIAWQLDAWLLNHIRIGAGFGLLPYFSKLPGNPILVPLPELSIGTHFEYGNLAYLAGLTANLGYGNRGSLGIGYSF